MSHKRTLYKPVVQETVPNPSRRRPLAQGRLVTKPSIPQESWAAGTLGHTSGHTDTSYDGLVSSPRGGVLSTSPRRDLSALMGSLNNTGKSEQHEDEVSPHTPRKHQPHVSMEQSPRPMKPSVSLELSDTDSDTFSPTRTQVDPFEAAAAAAAAAAGTNKDDHQVRAVRHVPNLVNLDLKNTGTVPRSIEVDNLKSIIVKDINRDYDSAEQERSKSGQDHIVGPGAVVKENSMEGGWISPSGAPPLQRMFPDKPNRSLDVSAQDKPLKLSWCEASSVESVDRVETTRSSGVGAKKTDNAKAKLRNKPVIITEDDIKKKVKKKKAPRVVSSRYMTSSTAANDTTAADATKKGPMKATDRSVLAKSSASATNVRARNTSGIAGARKTNKTPVVSGSATAKAKTSYNATPELKNKGHNKASTPSQDTSLQPLGDVDVSAIAPHGKNLFSSVLSTPGFEGSSSSIEMNSPKSKNGVKMSKSHGNDSQQHSSLKSTQSINASSTVPTKKALESTQNQLNMTYCRYLQWLYLDSKSRKAAQQQEKKVMSQLYGLWQECEKEQAVKADLKQSLERVKHLTSVDDILELQEKGLEPICDSMDKMQRQYTTLAGALDTRRHQIPVRGIHLPDNQDQFIESLEKVLEESEQLLAELNRQAAPHSASVTSFAHSISAMEHTVETEVTQLEKLQELISAAQTLLTRESSLLIQDVHVTKSSSSTF